MSKARNALKIVSRRLTENNNRKLQRFVGSFDLGKLKLSQAAQAYSLYFLWELRERAIYKTWYGNLPDISKL